MPLSQFYCLLELSCGMSQDRMSLPGHSLAAEKRELSGGSAATSCASAGTTSAREAESKEIREVYLLNSNAGGTHTQNYILNF